MPEERTCASGVREKEIGGVVYCVKSNYSASGSLEEILKKAAIEAIRAGWDFS